MTQPIQEPSTDRALQGFAYARDQLLRRPAPTAGGVWPWVALVNAGQTVATGTSFTPSLFTEAYWDPALVGNPALGGGGNPFFVDPVQDGSGNWYFELYLQLEGWYTIEMIHEVDDLTNWAAGEYFQDRITQTAGEAFQLDERIGQVLTDELETGTQQFTQSHRTIWACNGDVQRSYEANVRQTSGVDKTVTGLVKVWYLAGVGGSTDNADWEIEVVAS